MIKAEKIDVWGFEHAVRGMRNPMNSWAQGDSCFNCGIQIGPKDLDLMKRLCKAGSEHRKFMRQIFVSMDLTLPLYTWKEFDTYKINTTSNSCSTMHKIHVSDIVIGDDISNEHLIGDVVTFKSKNPDELFDEIKKMCNEDNKEMFSANGAMSFVVWWINYYRDCYMKAKDNDGTYDGHSMKDYWWQMIQLLPSSYNQKRTVTFNYENALNMIRQRTGHKQDEWNIFVDEIKNKLPYLNEIVEWSKE